MDAPTAAQVEQVASALSLRIKQVQAVADFLVQGATVPFIARYRKEATGSLDEVALAAIRDQLAALAELDKRREAIVTSLKERGLLSAALARSIASAQTRSDLEDLYLPCRPRRKTRASAARERGLEPLADALSAEGGGRIDARPFVDAKRGVPDVEAAFAGARDILAERISEDAPARGELRALFTSRAQLAARVIKSKQKDAAKYRDYFDWGEALHRAPSHRVLAILRGKAEGFLTVTARPPEEEALRRLRRRFAAGHSFASKQRGLAVTDAYKRLIQPSLEKEAIAATKLRADREAIDVFATNLREILMAAPLGPKPVLAIDPGFRSGCKCAVLGPYGALLHNMTIFPHTGGPRSEAAGATLREACERYSVEAIAIGNGTAGRETEAFVEALGLDIIAIAVDESGASIYSASEVAREEFPDLDLTVRGAVSIGRRLQDPLAELVKLDPKSIGVGQYQHDVEPRALAASLSDTIESAVNSVGVELNTASPQLLAHVAGLGSKLASAIVKYRAANGPFRDRASLTAVPRLGSRAFQQAAGFLRVRDASHPLDGSAVHPERYDLVERIAKDQNCRVLDLLQDPKRRAAIEVDRYVSEEVGAPTLHDIVDELGKPGRDPRPDFEVFRFADVHDIKDLTPGVVLPGIVTNVTSFGAFVDIGVHTDGLVHVSQLADRFVKDPNEVVRVRQKVRVTVTQVDLDRKRIALSMRSDAKAQ
ncbi:MAG: Tex family protein [Nannocystales bacterium]